MNDMLTWGKQNGLKSFEQVSFDSTLNFSVINFDHKLMQNINILGERYLFASGSVFGSKRTVDTHLQTTQATSEKLLQATTR